MKNYFNFIFRNRQSSAVFLLLLIMAITIPTVDFIREGEFNFLTLFFAGVLGVFLIGTFLNYRKP